MPPSPPMVVFGGHISSCGRLTLSADFQFVERHDWIPGLGVSYANGMSTASASCSSSSPAS